MRRAAFTLIEMLVVIGIMVTISGMIMLTPGSSEGEAVAREAQRLKAALMKARMMARRDQMPYSVVFNMEGDGRALASNEGGGHWYCILGPDKRFRNTPLHYMYTREHDWSVNHGDIRWGRSTPADEYLTDWRRLFSQLMVEQPHRLEAGVRFLALSDRDPTDPGDSAGTALYDGAIPWYGTFIDGVYHPWGSDENGRVADFAAMTYAYPYVMFTPSGQVIAGRCAVSIDWPSGRIDYADFDSSEGLSDTGAYHITLATESRLAVVDSPQSFLADLRAVHRVAIDKLTGIAVVRGVNHPVCQVTTDQLLDATAEVYP